MTQKGSPKRGDVYNWDQIRDVTVNGIAASENIADGAFVYQDGANGLKQIPTTAIEGSRVRFAPTGFDNSSGSLGDREIESVKSGARVVAQADGAIVVGDPVALPAADAGKCSLDATPDLLTTFGFYVGHVGEMEGTANEPTDAADDDLVVIQMI